jgi:antitoxin PrlF
MAMGYAAVVEEFSTITAKGQTTVPKPVRQALGLKEGDQIAFRVDEKGVTVRRADDDREDPAIASFLSFLARDIEKNPENLKSLSPDLIKRIASLVEGVDVDVDAPIEGDVDL